MQDPAGVRIVAVEDAATCRILEAIQREVWGAADVVPYHQLLVAGRFGGTLLLAYAGGEPAGFVYGFPALHDGRLVLHSHMLAVRPAFRDHGVGRALKLAQREHARRLGYPLVTWTFDPLECRNAYFNLQRLGARFRTYLVDFYGRMVDALNQGLPSDRLLAEWETGGPAGAAADAPGTVAGVAAAGAPEAFPARPRADGWPEPGDALLTPAAGDPPLVVRVPVPASIQALKAADPELALRWRLAVRDALQAWLGAGYEGAGFLPPHDRERGTGAYLLRREAST